jgi:predicted peptidase
MIYNLSSGTFLSRRRCTFLMAWVAVLLCMTAPIGYCDDVIPGQTAQKLHLEKKQILDTDYLLFLPKGYGQDVNKRWPLILFLHGAGERGSNIWSIAKNGLTKVDTQMTNFPFIVVSPQCAEGQMWSDDSLLALLDEIESKYAVDTHRVYLTGLSMGGFETWNLGLSHPERFAAIAPVCGGGETILLTLALDFDKERLEKIRTLGVWAFHGGKDTTVLTEESVRMVNELKKIGCTDVKLTIYPQAQHDSWTQAYAEPELYAWFLQHSR